jgi:integrase
MWLLLDHDLRVEEVAILTAKAFDMKAGTFTFYRPKVNKTQTHTITPDTRNVARASLRHAPADGTIWRKSSKGTGKLGAQLSETSAPRAINKRVEPLGRHAG